MSNTRAIELCKKNLNVIANTGVISRADAQALFESTVTTLTPKRYFIVDYVDADGNRADFFAPDADYFSDNFTWTETPTSGFRHCKLK